MSQHPLVTVGAAIIAGTMLMSDGVVFAVTHNPGTVAALASISTAIITAVVGPVILQRGNRRAEALTRIEGKLDKTDSKIDATAERVDRNHETTLNELRTLGERVATIEGATRRHERAS